MNGSDHRCGHVALIGRPNVGKSTLLNQLLGQKLSITSSKPQTTRHRILGIRTLPEGQILYVDTPGLHQTSKRALNRYMNRTARTVLNDVDIVLWVVEALKWTEGDEYVLQSLSSVALAKVLVINKVDKVKDKGTLLAYLGQMAGKLSFSAVMPLSARHGDNLDRLEQELLKRLPLGPALYADDQITDRSQRFLAAELIREQLMRVLEEEVPYAATVEIERFEEKGQLLHISAIIWVEKNSQKAIVIGKQGTTLKEIGRRARLNMERLFGQRVFLETWVSVKAAWSENDRLLSKLGYDDGKILS